MALHQQCGNGLGLPRAIAVHVKIAFFHLSVWLIGQSQGDWKTLVRFLAFAAQAEMCRWAEIPNSVIFENLKVSV